MTKDEQEYKPTGNHRAYRYPKTGVNKEPVTKGSQRVYQTSSYVKEKAT